jgi:predicted TPR repeat methyltransferase
MARTDDDALAEAYNRALALEKSGDFDLAAAAYAEVLALDPDDHGGAAVRLASMKRGEVPARAPEAYVTTCLTSMPKCSTRCWSRIWAIMCRCCSDSG